MNLANIISGGIAGSVTVTVACNEVNGTTVIVTRGAYTLGSAVLASGLATVTLSAPLATGDVIVASVTELGNKAGLPVVVVASDIEVTGWRSATEVEIRDHTGALTVLPVSQFFATYGYLPAGIEDVAGEREILYPEFAPVQTGVQGIAFDVTIIKGDGITTVTVVGAQNLRGTLMVKFGSAAWGTATSADYTTSQSVIIKVKGSENTDDEAATRVITVDVIPSGGGGGGGGSGSIGGAGGGSTPPASVNFGFSMRYLSQVTFPYLQGTWAIDVYGASGTVEYRTAGGSWSSSNTVTIQYFDKTGLPTPNPYSTHVMVEVRTSTGQYSGNSVALILYW